MPGSPGNDLFIMKKSAKKQPEQISFFALAKSLRLPVATKTGRAFKSKKEYDCKDKSWEKDCLNLD